MPPSPVAGIVRPSVTLEAVRRHAEGSFGNRFFNIHVRNFRPDFFRRVQDRMLRAVVASERFKALMIGQLGGQVFATSAAEAGREFKARFRGEEATFPASPWWLKSLFRLAVSPWIPSVVVGALSRFTQERVGNRFRIGRSLPAAMRKISRLGRQGLFVTADVVGEQVRTPKGADRYRDQVIETIHAWVRGLKGPVRTSDDEDGVPVIHISVKLSNLSHRFQPECWGFAVRDASARLAEIVRVAADYTRQGIPVMINIDREGNETSEMADEAVRCVFGSEEFRDFNEFGIVLTASRKDAPGRLDRWLSWSLEHGKRPQIRLVKGAMVRYDRTVAARRGWPDPTQPDLGATHRVFEEMALKLLANHSIVRPAFGTHNPYDVIMIQAARRELGLPPHAAEMQFLYGLGEPFVAALKAEGVSVRLYGPYGRGADFLGYFTRRLDEVDEGSATVMIHTVLYFDRVVAQRRLATEEAPRVTTVRDMTFSPDPLRQPFRREPEPDHTDPKVREAIGVAFDRARWPSPRENPLLIGERADGLVPAGVEWRFSVDPTYPSRQVGLYPKAGPREVDLAVATANRCFEGNLMGSLQDRRLRLLKAAEILRARMFEVARLITREAGKPVELAIHEVIEAIEGLEEDARVAAAIWARQPFGVVAVIGPRNFPLAIPFQNIGAALVAGNPVVFKPAKQTPIVGRVVVEILREAGFPPEAVQWLPGGREVGEPLVSHTGIDAVIFTGSLKVAREIDHLIARHPSARRGPKLSNFETGANDPTNALIVDSGADPDLAAQAAFEGRLGYSGQRCSAVNRVVVVGASYQPFLDRLVDRVDAAYVDDPADPVTEMGPLADQASVDRHNAFVAAGVAAGWIPVRNMPLPVGLEGFFAGAVVFAGAGPTHPLWPKEMFGPVLLVGRARNIEEAIRLARGGLTGGIISNDADHIRWAARQVRVGNFYVNRSPTGARRVLEPFGGGFGGRGAKLGGLPYLLRLTLPPTLRTASFSVPVRGEIGAVWIPFERGEPKRLEGVIAAAKKSQDVLGRLPWQDRVRALSHLHDAILILRDSGRLDYSDRFTSSDIDSLLAVLRNFQETAPRLLERRQTMNVPGDHATIAHDWPRGIEVVYASLDGVPFWKVAAAAARGVIMGNAVILATGRGRSPLVDWLASLFAKAGFPVGAVLTLSLPIEAVAHRSEVRRIVYHGSNPSLELSLNVHAADVSEGDNGFRDFSGSHDDPRDTERYLSGSASARVVSERTFIGGTLQVPATEKSSTAWQYPKISL